MSKKLIQTNAAPTAIGPYSQAVRAGDLVFCSGQIPLNPKTGEISLGSIEDEARQVLDNLMAVVRAAGGEPDHVVKTTIYLTDINQFGKINDIYGSYFKAPFPARATVQVAALPKGAHVMIDATLAL